MISSPDIDIPDFDRALQESRDGSFQRAVAAALDRSLSDVRSQLHRGLTPLEFEQARALETALVKAHDVLRFSRHSS